MSRTRLSFVVSVLCAAVACSSQPESPSPASADAAIAQADAAAPPQAAGANTCLLEYQSRYDALLTLDLAASAAELSADTAEVSYQKALENPQYHEISYSWPSDRVRVVALGERTRTVPRQDVVALGGIRSMEAERFRRSYRAVSDEDAGRLDQAIDESKEEGLETAQQKSIAKGLAGMAAAVTKAYRDVPSVGDAASFNTIESKLYVLDRGVSFVVTADTSDDPDANQAVAVQVARQIIRACS